jgi:hypothetical protein
MGLIGSFFGSDQRKDLERAKAQSDQQLQQGYDQAYGDYTEAGNYFSPYASQGQQANTFYNDALGLNGDPARTTATNTLTSNPLFQGELGAQSNAVSRALNAQGASGGGKAQLAAQRVFQGTAGNWLDRYANQGAQGLQATNAMASARMGRGDLSYGYGASKAGNAINFGNAMASNRNTGINNLMGLAGSVISGINAFRQPKLGS